MGAYLSAPVCNKISEKGENDRIRYGASAMQGWRMQQEDAHNCILDFDNGASFFAVYDGHGGMEVSKYASDEFPQTLSSIDDWKNGRIGEALESAFLKFDEKLLQPEVIEKMTEIAGGSESDRPDNEEDEDKARLLEEASLPLEEVLSRYGVTLRRKKRESGDSATSDADETDQVVSPTKENIPVKDTKKQEKPVKRDANGVVKTPSKQQEDNNPPEDPKIDSTKPSVENEPLEPESKKVRLNSSKTDENNFGSVKNEISPKSGPIRNGSENNVDSIMEVDGAVEEDMKIECRKVETDEKGEVVCESTEIIECHRENGKSQDQKSSIEEPKEQKNEDDDEEDDDEEYEESAEPGEDEEDDEDEEDEEEEEEEEEEGNDDRQTLREVLTEAAYETFEQFPGPSAEIPGNSSGTTACVLVIKDDRVYVANVGDSRCVLCRNGKALDLSIDHKPEDDVERRRVEAAGGAVTDDGRVNGGLNMSRALGDHFYKSNKEIPLKDQMISPLPDIQTEKLQDDDTFLVLACDGIWNSMSSQAVVDFVAPRLKAGIEPFKICEELCDGCLATTTVGDGTGCDNMTVVIVDLKKHALAAAAGDQAANPGGTTTTLADVTPPPSEPVAAVNVEQASETTG